MRTWQVVYVEGARVFEKIQELNEAPEQAQAGYTIRLYTRDKASAYVVEKEGRTTNDITTLIEGCIQTHASTDIRLVYLAMIEALQRLKEHSDVRRQKGRKPIVKIVFQNGKYLYQMQIIAKNVQEKHLNPVATEVRALKLKNMELQLEIIKLNQDFIFKYDIDTRMMILDVLLYNHDNLPTLYDYNYEYMLAKKSKSARSNKSSRDELESKTKAETSPKQEHDTSNDE